MAEQVPFAQTGELAPEQPDQVALPDHATPEDELDSILDRLEGDHGMAGEDEEPAEPQAPEEADEAPTDEGAGEAGDESAPQPEPSVDKDELRRALTILGKERIPANVIAGMSDKDKIAWAEELEPLQSQRANDYRELGELRKKGAGETTEAASEGVGGAAEPPVNPEVNLSAFRTAVTEELGEDTAKVLMTPLEGLLGYVQKLEGMVSGLQGGMRGLYVADARRGLTGEYPQLQDDNVFEQVEDLAEAMYHSGKYSTIDELYSAAAKVVLASELAEQKASARKQEVTQRTLGQVTPPGPAREAPQAPMTPEDIEEAALEALDKGEDPRAVRARLQNL